MERGSHWYYERARGSYLDDKARQGTPSQQKEWARQNPPNQKFTKTDLAKYEHAWLGLAHLVCRGAEKNFEAFASRLEDDAEPEVDRVFFEQVAARAIIWRAAEKAFNLLDLKGYRANSVAYGVAWIAERSGRRLDLGKIWRDQCVPDALASTLRTVCGEAHKFLTDGRATWRGVQEGRNLDRFPRPEFRRQRRLGGLATATPPAFILPRDQVRKRDCEGGRERRIGEQLVCARQMVQGSWLSGRLGTRPFLQLGKVGGARRQTKRQAGRARCPNLRPGMRAWLQVRGVTSVVDVFSKAKRSEVMSKIRGRNTRTERALRSLLHRAGYRFRLHVSRLPGKPDIVLPRYHTVIMVHGCFWRRHLRCRFAYDPKTRVAFWRRKFAENVGRDRRVKLALQRLGWRVVTVWECELRDADRVIAGLKMKLRVRQ